MFGHLSDCVGGRSRYVWIYGQAFDMVSWPLSGVACHTTCFSSSGLWLEPLSDSSRNSTEILDVSLEFPPYLSCRKVSILEYLNPCGQNVWFKLRIGRSKTARQPICSLLPSLLISLAANWGSHVLVTSTLKGRQCDA